jgi:cell division protein FtsZ
LRDAKTVWLIAELRSWDLLFLQEKIELKKQLFHSRFPIILNDNKITGAKNVLLLIVSGSNEITLENRRNNDHIQTEAGFN